MNAQPNIFSLFKLFGNALKFFLHWNFILLFATCRQKSRLIYWYLLHSFFWFYVNNLPFIEKFVQKSNLFLFHIWSMWCSTATFQAFAGNRLTIYKDIPALEKNAWINKFYGQMNSTVNYLPKWMVLIDCLLQIQYQVSMPQYLYFRICNFI